MYTIEWVILLWELLGMWQQLVSLSLSKRSIIQSGLKWITNKLGAKGRDGWQRIAVGK